MTYETAYVPDPLAVYAALKSISRVVPCDWTNSGERGIQKQATWRRRCDVVTWRGDVKRGGGDGVGDGGATSNERIFGWWWRGRGDWEELPPRPARSPLAQPARPLSDASRRTASWGASDECCGTPQAGRDACRNSRHLSRTGPGLQPVIPLPGPGSAAVEAGPYSSPRGIRVEGSPWADSDPLGRRFRVQVATAGGVAVHTYDRIEWRRRIGLGSRAGSGPPMMMTEREASDWRLHQSDARSLSPCFAAKSLHLLHHQWRATAMLERILG
jgi:hypothetical protein